MNSEFIYYFKILFSIIILLTINFDFANCVIKSRGIIKLKFPNGQIVIANRKVVTFEDYNSDLDSNSSEKIVYELLGIPFAQPPVDDKRFKFPVRLTKLLPTNPYNATIQRSSCLQVKDEYFENFEGSEMWNAPDTPSEDCLYMNIWIPIKPEQDELFQMESNKRDIDMKHVKINVEENDKLATLFWIYGGSFISGTINLKIYDATIIAAYENVIVVSSNYRVGVFGFLYFNTSSVPGNAGLYDQIMALEWYKENYASLFDASNTNICLFGESAGSMSIQFHMNSEKKHLFNSAIFESGSAYLDLSYHEPENAYNVSIEVALQVGCLNYSSIEEEQQQEQQQIDQNTFDKMIECLKNVDSLLLLNKQYEVKYVNRYLQMPFIPTIDYHNYVYINPNKITDYKNSSHNILVFVNQDEGSYFLFYAYVNVYFNLTKFSLHNNSYDYNDEFVEYLLSPLLFTNYTDMSKHDDTSELDAYANCLTKVYDSYEEFNFNQPLISRDELRLRVWRKLTKILGDKIFACPSIKLADLYKHAEDGNRMSFMKFNYRSKLNLWPSWLGVMHGYEIEFLFGMPWLYQDKYTDDDRYISKLMMNYWANFAKYGQLLSNYDYNNKNNKSLVNKYAEIKLKSSSRYDDYDEIDTNFESLMVKEYKHCKLFNDYIFNELYNDNNTNSSSSNSNSNKYIKRSTVCNKYLEEAINSSGSILTRNVILTNEYSIIITTIILMLIEFNHELSILTK